MTAKPTATRRNDWCHSSFFRFFYNLLAVVPFIRKQIFSIYSFDKVLSLAAIRSGTFCDKHSDRHTMRIHGQMYLGIEPPLVRAIS